MSEIIFIVENSEEGGYIAKALGYSIYTEGESLDELKEEEYCYEIRMGYTEGRQQPEEAWRVVSRGCVGFW